jgi:hypothetical protein
MPPNSEEGRRHVCELLRELALSDVGLGWVGLLSLGTTPFVESFLYGI